MRLAMLSDSLESQYAVTVYAWPRKTPSFPQWTGPAHQPMFGQQALPLSSKQPPWLLQYHLSNESASCRAPRARVRALDDAVCALLASSSAFPSESWAFSALVRASLAWDRAVEIGDGFPCFLVSLLSFVPERTYDAAGKLICSD